MTKNPNPNPPDPDIRISEWWGVNSRNGELLVLHHIDSPVLAPARRRLTEALTGIVVNRYLRELEAQHRRKT